MTNLLSRFAKDKSGATAIEYGLIAGFVSIAIIAALQIIWPAAVAHFPCCRRRAGPRSLSCVSSEERVCLPAPFLILFIGPVS